MPSPELGIATGEPKERLANGTCPFPRDSHLPPGRV